MRDEEVIGRGGDPTPRESRSAKGRKEYEDRQTGLP
jgi:hypothetical protein